MQLGRHFGLDDAQAEALLAADGDDAIRELLEQFEEADVAHCDTDKAWDPISCALAPESGAERDPDEWPAYGVVLGDFDLAEDPDELMATYLEPAHVAEVSAWLATLDEELFDAAYDAMPEELRNPEYGPDERGYAWDNVVQLREFFRESAHAGRHVVFHVEG